MTNHSHTQTVLTDEEWSELEWAHLHLEHPSLAARLSSVIGIPIEQALHLIPQYWYRRIEDAVERSIQGMLDLTIQGMDRIAPTAANDALHKWLVMGTGAVGGFFGLPMLLVELPLTTALMLRSIADIAHSQGEDLDSEDARIACMQVFALGGRTKEDSAADTGYYGLRVTLGLHLPGLLPNLARADRQIPAAVNFARGVAARFGVVISDKAAAQMVPMAGAAGGAALNYVFMDHFQDIARGHFIVRRLERIHGEDSIREAYEHISQREAEAGRIFSPLEGW